MKTCELCKEKATIACEADDAVLCWDCDETVHGANFLVAKHNRILLCRFCQEQTPWNASGSRLGRTFSVCDRCSNDEAPPPEVGERVRGGRVQLFAVQKNVDEPFRCGCSTVERSCGGWIGDEERRPNTKFNVETPPPHPSSSSCDESSSERSPIRSGFFARKGRNRSRSQSDREDSLRRATYAVLHHEESEECEEEEEEGEEEEIEEEAHCLSDGWIKPTYNRKRPPPPTPSTGASRRRRTLHGRPSAIRRFPDYMRREKTTRV